MACFEDMLNLWMEEFKGLEQLRFRHYNIDGLFYLRGVKIETPLLLAAAKLWVPEIYVFRFGFEELCPTIEEFEALLGCEHRTNEALPRPNQNLVTLLMRLYGFKSQEEAQSYILNNNEVAISKLVDKFRPTGRLADVNGVQLHRHNALYICLLARFLLVSSDGKVCSTLIDITDQISLHYVGIMGLVLAETLMGLDAVHQGKTDVFAGSPLLLQMWLQDRLKCLEKPPPTIPRCWPEHYPIRKVLINKKTEANWKNWLNVRTGEDIRWYCSWWGTKPMTFSTRGHFGVALVGLKQITYYFPARILRQFKYSQTQLPYVPSYRWSVDHIESFLTTYGIHWTYRQIRQFGTEGFQPKLSYEYQQLLLADIDNKYVDTEAKSTKPKTNRDGGRWDWSPRNIK